MRHTDSSFPKVDDLADQLSAFDPVACTEQFALAAVTQESIRDVIPARNVLQESVPFSVDIRHTTNLSFTMLNVVCKINSHSITSRINRRVHDSCFGLTDAEDISMFKQERCITIAKYNGNVTTRCTTSHNGPI